MLLNILVSNFECNKKKKLFKLGKRGYQDDDVKSNFSQLARDIILYSDELYHVCIVDDNDSIRRLAGKKILHGLDKIISV